VLVVLLSVVAAPVDQILILLAAAALVEVEVLVLAQTVLNH
jgi:hypothetical protein